MTDSESGANPFAVPGAEKPRVGWYDIDGCRLYAETRGQGPAILIIGAASDDAEMFRPIAERLTGSTVVTYDPRGTLRSDRGGWPCDSARHADDAAELLRTLGLAGADSGVGVDTSGHRADIPLTGETVDTDALARSRVDIHFACGSGSPERAQPCAWAVSPSSAARKQCPQSGLPRRGHPRFRGLFT
ncbi:MAG: alpha/beta hydrolase [Cryobacterium sp.]|nr:alpha/beta hydrolase [Cryobacterium sp.]